MTLISAVVRCLGYLLTVSVHWLCRCVPSEFFWKRPDMASSGFCLLNTVAVAAAYAMYRYGRETPIAQDAEGTDTSSSSSRSGPLRIAIVDIDVHHGNGTEEIVRNLRCILPSNSSTESTVLKLNRPQRTQPYYPLCTGRTSLSSRYPPHGHQSRLSPTSLGWTNAIQRTFYSGLWICFKVGTGHIYRSSVCAEYGSISYPWLELFLFWLFFRPPH